MGNLSTPRDFSVETLEEGQRSLAESVVGLAEGLARQATLRTGCSWIEHDMVSAAIKAVCRAAQSYNLTRGTSFRSYAVGGIKMALNDELRRQRPMGFRRNYDPRFNIVHSGDDIVACADNTFNETKLIDDQDSFNGWMKLLLPEQETVMRLMFEEAEPTSFRSIGAKLGKKTSEVSAIYHEGICALRNEIKVARSCGRA